MTSEALARLFHDTYEEYAPFHHYKTRKNTREFNPESKNGQLMIDVCQKINMVLREEKHPELLEIHKILMCPAECPPHAREESLTVRLLKDIIFSFITNTQSGNGCNIR